MGLDWYEQPPYYITAYEYAVKAGYEGTEEEFAAGVARSATAADDAEAAATAAEDAQEAAETAQGKAEDAQEAAETAAATFETDTTLSVEGKAADAAVVGEFIRGLEIGNAKDVFAGLISKESGTLNGVTYTWEENSCTVTGGTQSEWSANVLIAISDLPPNIVPGNWYSLKYKTTNTDVSLRFRFYDGEGQQLLVRYYAKDAHFSIPVNAKKWNVVLSVRPGITFSTAAIVSEVAFLDAPSNEDLMDMETGLAEYAPVNYYRADLRRTNRVQNGMHYTWDGDVCEVYGTATSVSVSVMMMETPLPTDKSPEDDFYIRYKTTNSAVRLRVLFFDDVYQQLPTVYYITKDRTITIPDGAHYISVGIYVASGTVIDESAPAYASGVAILNKPPVEDQYILNGRDADTYIPKVLCWYAIPASATEFDAKTLEGNSFTRATYGVLSSTFEGTDPPPEITSLSNSVNLIVEKHLHNTAGNLYHLDVTCNKPPFHYRLTRYASAGGDYRWLWDKAERKYLYTTDLNADKFLFLNTTYLHFRESTQTSNNVYYRSIVIPVKTGDTIYLHTKIGSGPYGVYSKIKYNYIVDEVYTDSDEFYGNITFDYDGFLAFNLSKTYDSLFECYIETAASAFDIRRDAQFANALLNDKNTLPEYDDNNVCRVLTRGPSWMGAIHHWGIIGASFDSGEFNYNKPDVSQDFEIDWYEYSCWRYLQRINGIPDMYCYSDGGQNARDWIMRTDEHPRGHAYDSDEEEAVTSWPYRSGIGHDGGCWWKMLEDYQNGNVKQAFVLNLGGNDINNENPHDENWDEIEEGQYDATKKYKCGTVADIGTYDLETDTDTPPVGKTGGVIPGIVNSFSGYMGAILNRLIAIQPQCKIFLCTIHNMYTDLPKRKAMWDQYNDLIRQLATLEQYRNNVFILDAAEYGPNFRTDPQVKFWVRYHPNALGYVYMAWTWNTMIDYVMQKNLSSFSQSMFIGTGKKYTPAT